MEGKQRIVFKGSCVTATWPPRIVVAQSIICPIVDDAKHGQPLLAGLASLGLLEK